MMTVNQYIHEIFIGKEISFLVEEHKKKIDGPVFGVYIASSPNWFQYEDWTKLKDEYGKELYWAKTKKISEKVIQIKRVRNYWILKTMSGFLVHFDADQDPEKLLTSVPEESTPTQQ